MDELPNRQQPYPLGYREGFRDGFGEADRRAEEARMREEDGKKDQGGNKGGEGDDKKGGEGGEGDSKDGKKDDGKKDDDKKDDDKKDGKPPLYKRPVVVGIALVVLLLLIIAAILFWRHSRQHESTDDAFIDGQSSTVAAQTSGRVLRLYVTDNQHVNVGDPLVDIDSADNQTRVAQARGQLATSQATYEESIATVASRRASVAESAATVRQNQADLTKAIQDLQRYREVNPEAVAKQQVDAAVQSERNSRAKVDSSRMSLASAKAQVEVALATVRSNKAQVDASQASLDSANLQNGYNHVVAPIAGRVSRRTVEPGNVINNGQALMSLVSDSLWVTANYKETQLTRMQRGQEVEIVVDAFPDIKFRGRIDSIQRATGQYFSMLPAENATGNYVKVVQRVPVKITFDDNRINDYTIGPGMSVTPNVLFQ